MSVLPYSKTNIDKLEMAQRRAAHIALNRYHNTSSVSADVTVTWMGVTSGEKDGAAVVCVLQDSKDCDGPGHTRTFANND